MVMATQYLVAAVDEINYPLLFKDTTSRKARLIAELNLALRRTGTQDQSGTIQSQLHAAWTIAAIVLQVQQGDAQSPARKQLAEKHITNLDDFAQVANYVSQRLVSAKAFFDATLLQTRSMREIESAMKGGSTLPETIAAHFSFDLACWPTLPGPSALSVRTPGRAPRTSPSPRSRSSSRTTSRRSRTCRRRSRPPLACGCQTTASPSAPTALSTRNERIGRMRFVRSHALRHPVLPAGDPGQLLDQDEMPVRGSWQLQGLAPQLIATRSRAIAGYNELLTPTCGLVVEPTLDEKLVIQSSAARMSPDCCPTTWLLGSDGSDGHQGTRHDGGGVEVSVAAPRASWGPSPAICSAAPTAPSLPGGSDRPLLHPWHCRADGERCREA